MNEILKPPIYCPHAVATDSGWVNPKTGELLIAIRGLISKIEESKLATQYQETLPVIEISVDPTPEDPIMEEPELPETLQIVDDIQGKKLTLAIVDEIGFDDTVNKPKQRGRPKKVK